MPTPAAIGNYATLYQEAVPGGADFLDDDFAISSKGTAAIRVTVSVSANANLSLETDDGTTQDTILFGALTANKMQTFTFGAIPGMKYNFTTDGATAQVVNYFAVEEVTGGVLF